jgi:hypothetical protein
MLLKKTRQKLNTITNIHGPWEGASLSLEPWHIPLCTCH